ncbi:MAG TPA: response regulator [Acidimicrobiales bacterium]|nr:response regulator [Acidimicrobiales bacterium]
MEIAVVRVLIVDDSSDIRLMLRLLLGRDDRFDVVGEGGDGREAIELAAQLRPDVVLLDRHMPRLGGLEAMPEIRRVSPDTEIVLYTAAGGAETEAAAMGAGAIGVLWKRGATLDLGQELAAMLARHWADPTAEVEIRVGPVPSEVARLWVANTQKLLSAVEAHPEVLEPPVAERILAVYHRLLDAWEAVADETDSFLWVGQARADELQQVVEEWVRLDSMDDATLDALGCAWSSPEARPFFEALTAGVVSALRRHAETRRLAERLVSGGWAAPSA